MRSNQLSYPPGFFDYTSRLPAAERAVRHISGRTMRAAGGRAWKTPAVIYSVRGGRPIAEPHPAQVFSGGTMPTPIGNFFMSAIIRSPFYRMLGENFAVITVTGRKSGKRISTPINVAPEQGGWTVISMRSRVWWRNLSGNAEAKLHFAGKEFPVRGEILEDHEQVAAGLTRYFDAYPSVAKYFNIKMTPENVPDPASLRATAAERVIIRLRAA
jgi:deazaflavin-dependent oxidoreductase (nitroreductase family)